VGCQGKKKEAGNKKQIESPKINRKYKILGGEDHRKWKGEGMNNGWLGGNQDRRQGNGKIQEGQD